MRRVTIVILYLALFCVFIRGIVKKIDDMDIVVTLGITMFVTLLLFIWYLEKSFRDDNKYQDD